MASQRNSVTDYMVQKKSGTATAAMAPPVTYRTSPSVTNHTSPHVTSRAPLTSRTTPPLTSRTTPPLTSSISPGVSPETSPTSTPTHTSSSPHLDDGDSETEASEEEDLSFMSLNDLLLSPSRQHFQTLVPLSFAQDPEGAWFKLTHRVSGRIREIITSDFKDAAHNWSKTPKDVQQRWFKAFAQRYNWDPVHTSIIYDEFKKNAGTRLRNLVSDWKRRGKKPVFMGNKAWKRLQKHWASDDHKATSKRTSKARKSKRDGLGPSVHCMGQKSFLRRQYELRDENGEFPSHVTLLEDTHTRKGDGVIIDLKTIQILNEVQEKAENTLSQMSESQYELDPTQALSKSQLDQIYKEIVPIKGGRRYGMGSIPDSDLPSTSSFTPNPIYATLRTDLQSTQEELSATKDMLAKQTKLMETMNERFKNYEVMEAFYRENRN